MTAVEDLFAEESDLFLDEICTWLAVEHNITISSSSLSRNLKQAGLSRKMLQKIARELDDIRREEFKDSLRNDFIGDDSEFIVLDETSKNQHTYARHYGRSHHGQRAQLCDVSVRGDRYSLCAAMTIDGYLATRVIEGSFDAQEFYGFVLEDVVFLSYCNICLAFQDLFNQLPHMNPYPEERSVLVLDNCRIHHNQDLVDLVESAGCVILYLPPYSPDLTPIEESFGALKAYIRRHGDKLRRYEDPVEALYEATGCITPENAYAWFKNAGYIVT